MCPVVGLCTLKTNVIKRIFKPSSYCPGLAPRYAPDGGPGDTVLNREDYRGGTVVNRDDPWWTVLIRFDPAGSPGCFKMFNTTGGHLEE